MLQSTFGENSTYWSTPYSIFVLTHWGRVTHICVGKLTIIGSDNGLSPERRQAITWTNARILLIGPLETKFSEVLIEIQTFSLMKIRLKMSSAKCSSFRLGLNVLSYVASISMASVNKMMLRRHYHQYHIVWEMAHDNCATNHQLSTAYECNFNYHIDSNYKPVHKPRLTIAWWLIWLQLHHMIHYYYT